MKKDYGEIMNVAKKRYTGEVLRVYVSILASPNGIKQKEIAMITNMKPAHISRAVKILVENSHIFREETVLKVTKGGNCGVTIYGNKLEKKVTTSGNKYCEKVTKGGNSDTKNRKTKQKKPPGENLETPVISTVSEIVESEMDESKPENLPHILLLKNTNSNELNKKTIKNTKDYNSYSSDIKSIVNLFINTFDGTSRLKQELKKTEYCEAIERLMRKDIDPTTGKSIYTIDVITQAVIQGREDNFWRKNFLSLNKLEKKNEKLDMRHIDIFLNLNLKKSPVRPKVGNQGKLWDYHDGGKDES